MVNVHRSVEHLDVRDRLILDNLRASKTPISGQVLARDMGISRVALWKRIEHLKSFNYAIDGSSKGYLLRDDDAITPWEFDDGSLVIYQSEVESTMDEAWKHAEAGATAGTMVVADRQNAGRGRLGRTWESPQGGLYLTLVLRPSLPVSFSSALVLQAASVLIDWFKTHTGYLLGFQWPNDMMAGDKKVGGLLVEAAGSPEFPRYYILGLGMNIHEVGLNDRPSVGLADLVEHPPLRRVLAATFRERILSWCHRPSFSPEWWERNCLLKGNLVRIRDWQGKEELGTALGFDVRGALRFADQSGVKKVFLPGDTSLVRLVDELPRSSRLPLVPK